MFRRRTFVLFVFIVQVRARYLPDFFYWPGVCPPHAPYRECNPNPCVVHKCPKRQDVICEPNHCGGCRADFFDEQGNKIPMKSCYDFTCKPDLPIVSCGSLKKGKVKCEAHPDAIFIGRGGCHSCSTFFKFGRRLLARECVKKTIDNEHCDGPKKKCEVDPCKEAMCNATSDTLICIPDYCTCTHRFVNEYNQPIKCGEPIYNPKDVKCPTGTMQNKPVRCKADTCEQVCKTDPEAVCIHECGSCEPSYFDKRGNRLSKETCL